MIRGFSALVLLSVATIGLTVVYTPALYNAVTVSSGSIGYPTVEVDADLARTIGFNNLSLGAQIHGWDNFPQNQILKQKTSLLGLKLIRAFASSDKGLDPCIFWNETSCSGSFNWQKLDSLLDSIHQMGAEPLINIGSGEGSSLKFAPGMIGNFNGTGFPNPESFGSYVATIIRHLKATGRSVRFWEIWRTPNIRDASDEIREDLVLNYIQFFNSVQSYIHEADPDALLSSDRTFYRSFFDIFSLKTKGVGFLNYMKYDAFGTPFYRPEGYLNESRIMQLASSLDKPQTGGWAKYSPHQMQQKWFELSGQVLPVIVSEANVNSSFEAGTDPRIQTSLGAVWYAEALRDFILDGAVAYSVYYRLTSDESSQWGPNCTRGWGLGMIKNSLPYEEWPAYWVNYLFGLHLHPNDELLYETTSDSTTLSALAWRESTKNCVVLIAKQDITLDVNIRLVNASIQSESAVQICTINDGTSTPIYWNATYTVPLKLRFVGFTVCFLVIEKGG